MDKPDALPVAAIAALNAGDKIGAIKLVREERGIGLKEAKDAVEAYVALHPELQAALESAQARSTGALKWIVALVVLAVLAWVLLKH